MPYLSREHRLHNHKTKVKTMYNDAFVSALNADRERLYAERERERRESEILAQRVAADADRRGEKARRPRRRRAESLRLADAGR
jgi:hypothetical protein